jgi:short-chain fatty acids transporter
MTGHPSPPASPPAPPPTTEERPGLLARAALRLTAWSERWIPDAYIFALVGTLIVVLCAILTGHGLIATVDAWGKSFWSLIPFTLQMALVIITGYVLAAAPPVYRLIRALAAVPKSPRAAVALVTLFALLSSWLNWGFSLIFSAVLAREVARRVEADYRALCAASFLGVGSVWAQGLSGSAALQMATPGLLQPETRAIIAHGDLVPGGIVPLTHTIFLWQSLLSVGVELVLVTGLMYLVTPPRSRTRTAQDLGIDLGPGPAPAPAATARTPGQWLEHSPLLTLLTVLLGGTYIVHYFAVSTEGLNAINLNILNLSFLFLGILLHGTPARLMRAVQEATPAVWGVILQFPFYAGIAGVITGAHLNERIAGLFVRLASPVTLPPIVALYSALLGMFVPSGGSKWVIEAPYVMEAAHSLRVHLGWMVAVYDLGEALANLVQPFWMLPILGLFQLRARDVMGYTFVVFLVLLPVVLVLVTVLGLTLSYPL